MYTVHSIVRCVRLFNGQSLDRSVNAMYMVNDCALRIRHVCTINLVH